MIGLTNLLVTAVKKLRKQYDHNIVEVVQLNDSKTYLGISLS